MFGRRVRFQKNFEGLTFCCKNKPLISLIIEIGVYFISSSSELEESASILGLVVIFVKFLQFQSCPSTNSSTLKCYRHILKVPFSHTRLIPNEGRIASKMFQFQTRRIPSWTYSKQEVYQGFTVYVIYYMICMCI